MKKTFIVEVLILTFAFMKGYSQDLINPPVLQNIDTCQRVNQKINFDKLNIFCNLNMIAPVYFIHCQYRLTFLL